DLDPKKVRIPVSVEVPSDPGKTAAKVILQGFVDCSQLGAAIAECRQVSAAVPASVVAHVASTFLPVTPRKSRNLGRTQGRSTVIRPRLTRLGRKLFAKLRPQESSRDLDVQVNSAIRDRRKRTIAAVFQTLLERRR